MLRVQFCYRCQHWWAPFLNHTGCHRQYEVDAERTWRRSSVVDFTPALLPTSFRQLNDFHRNRLDLVKSALLLPVLHGVDKVLG